MNLKITEKQFYQILLEFYNGNVGIISEEYPNPPSTSEEIMSFQDWMDSSKGDWVLSKISNKYFKLMKDPSKGYGKFGPNTSSAWQKFGKEYSLSTSAKTTSVNSQTPVTSQTKLIGNKFYDPKQYNQNADLIANRLRQHNIPEKSIVAILGNLYVESRFKPNAVGDTKLSGGASVGIAQWRESRKNNLINFAKKLKRDPNEIETQVDFLVHELKTSYKPTWDAVMNPSTSVADTAKIFTINFERPANAKKESETRAKIAQEMINAHPDKFKVESQK